MNELAARPGSRLRPLAATPSAAAHAPGQIPEPAGGREPMVRRTDLGAKDIYYRAMVGPFAAIVGEQSSVMVIDSARTHRTDGRARLSISLDEAVAPCSFQCAAHSSRLFH